MISDHLPDPLVPQTFVHRRSSLHIPDQQSGDELLGQLGDGFIPIGGELVVDGGDVTEGLLPSFAEEGRSAAEQYESDHSKGPHICRQLKRLKVDDLGG